jgi:hypothetical protein
MGQVIQGPWKPLGERPPAQPVRGTSQCTIIRLRPFRIMPVEVAGHPHALAVAAEAGKSGMPAL